MNAERDRLVRKLILLRDRDDRHRWGSARCLTPWKYALNVTRAMSIVRDRIHALDNERKAA